MSACRGTKPDGAPCEVDERLVQSDGFCLAHKPGGDEHRRTVASLGGHATAARFARTPLTEADITPLTSMENAMKASAELHVWGLTERIKDKLMAVATKNIEVYVKTNSAWLTEKVVNEYRKENDAKAAKIAALEKQIAAMQGRGLRVAK